MKHKIGTMALGLFLSLGIIGGASACSSQKSFALNSVKPALSKADVKGANRGRLFSRVETEAPKAFLPKSAAVQQASQNLGAIEPYPENYHYGVTSNIFMPKAQLRETISELMDAWDETYADQESDWKPFATKAGNFNNSLGSSWIDVVKEFVGNWWGWDGNEIEWREEELGERSYCWLVSIINAIAAGDTNAIKMANLFGQIWGEEYNDTNFLDQLRALGRATGIYNAVNSNNYMDLYSENQDEYTRIVAFSLFMQTSPNFDTKEMYDFLRQLKKRSYPFDMVCEAIDYSLWDDDRAADSGVLVSKTLSFPNELYIDDGGRYK